MMPSVALLYTAQINVQHSHVAEHTFCCAGWLQERLENLYKKDPGYSDKAASLFMLDLQSPQELPDNLRGEQWNFVQLPLSALLEELSQVKQVRDLPKSKDLMALLPLALLPSIPGSSGYKPAFCLTITSKLYADVTEQALLCCCSVRSLAILLTLPQQMQQIFLWTLSSLVCCPACIWL